jgi:hypothetical protein
MEHRLLSRNATSSQTQYDKPDLQVLNQRWAGPLSWTLAAKRRP